MGASGVREGGWCRGEHGSEWSEREEGMVQGRAWERGRGVE